MAVGSRQRVIVVGGGNAALCAAISARLNGADVRVLECASREEAGGNTAFTAGAMRVAYRGADDIRALVPDLSDADIAMTDFGTYDAGAFYDDLARVTNYRADPELADAVASRSFETLGWMRDQGVRFAPIYGRQAFKVDGKFTFWGGLTLEVVGGGKGLIEYLSAACGRLGVDIAYGIRARALDADARGVRGLHARAGGEDIYLEADAVVLASGGFQANAEWRTKYLGPGWDLAKVRGSRHNVGDGLRMAIEAGASTAGHWSGCHAVAWDLNAPEFGDREIGDGFQKHSYPWGVVVNLEGKRFVDEGADFRNYTYAKYGREMLAQPQQTAWQVFDAKTEHLLRDEYRGRHVTRATGDTLEELAGKIDGLDREQFLTTIREYNAAVDTSVDFNPNVLDGRAAPGLSIPRSNWANPLDTPPFRAFGVTCGITYTFGGLRIDQDARVLNTDMEPINGLYAAGEIVGGLFYFNYPGGSGLTNGSVFGRRAGMSAATLGSVVGV